jgi:hypothetical protein
VEYDLHRPPVPGQLNCHGQHNPNRRSRHSRAAHQSGDYHADVGRAATTGTSYRRTVGNLLIGQPGKQTRTCRPSRVLSMD